MRKGENYIMGCCYSSCIYATRSTGGPSYKIALKLPHGLSYLEYYQGGFLKNENLDDWIHAQFRGKRFDHYVNYNDEHVDKTASKNGHCKGCIAWNDKEICWLIHSIPKLMIYFDKDGTITAKTCVPHSEQIFGQSLVFLSGIPISELTDLLAHVSIMKPFVDGSSSTYTLPHVDSTLIDFYSVHHIEHVAKSPNYHVDIFSEIFPSMFHGKWRCETWRRGHHCSDSLDVVDNEQITFQDIVYSSSHDHSKYACSDNGVVYIGDLNRMTTQYARGGGGVILHDPVLSKALLSIMR